MRAPSKGQLRPRSLLEVCWREMQALRPAFSHQATFMWFATIVIGFMVRSDFLGVTSIVRALNLKPKCYDSLLGNFHSRAINLDQLAVQWTKLALKLFRPVHVLGHLIFIGDGKKVQKTGKHIPSVKKLRQDASTKPEYIMGHSMQALCLLVSAASTFFAVPLVIRIHEGLVRSNRGKKTLIDKMLDLIKTLQVNESIYFVGDAYYANGKMALGLLEMGHDIVSRVKSNAVAFSPAEQPKDGRKRGRPAVYGKKIPLKSLFCIDPMIEVASPIYGETNVMIRYHVCDLLWRPVGRLVRFVAVVHPVRGACLLMSTDMSLDTTRIIHIYGLRFKIEHTFKQAVWQMGAFFSHFWMEALKPLRPGCKNHNLHYESPEYRAQVDRKMNAYHTFMQAAFIAHGLVQYLSVAFPKLVWASFGSWLRTIRPGIPPSELVVREALRNTLPDFLVSCLQTCCLAKFIADRQNEDTMEIFRLAS